MFLGACVDLGMPLDIVQHAVEQLDLERFGASGVTVEARRSRRGGISGVRFRVLQHGVPLEGPDPEEGAELGPGPAPVQPDDRSVGEDRESHSHEHGGSHRTWSEIRGLLDQSALPGSVKRRALGWFSRLAEVEGAIHGIEAERVHFHEVGAVDSIVDIVGAAAAIEWLAPDRITCGTVVVGSGTIDSAHGVLPVPAPATAQLLAGFSIESGPRGELVTPTGALLLAELVDRYESAPRMILEGQGYGLGRWDLPGRPNAFRLFQGSGAGEEGGWAPDQPERGRVSVIECQLDDLPGEGFGYLLERLLESGALDVYYTPVQMKKMRPGVLVSVLTRPDQLESLAALLLAESGSLGCRYSEMSRIEATRMQVEVETRWGRVRCKRASLDGRVLAISPEFEDCRRLARVHDVPWREVHRAAVVAAETLVGAGHEESDE